MAFRAGHVFGTFEKRATVLTSHHSHVYTKFAKAYLLSVNTLPVFSSSPEKTATTQTSIQTGKNKGTKFYLQCTKKSNPIFYKNKMSSSGKFVALVCLVVWNPLSKLVSVGYYRACALKRRSGEGKQWTTFELSSLFRCVPVFSSRFRAWDRQ